MENDFFNSIGQIRPYDDIPAMSGLTTSGHPHVTTEGLKSAITGREQAQQGRPLFDHLVGAQQHLARDRNAERFCRLEIERQYVLCRCLHW